MKKKIILGILVIVGMFTITGCGNKEEDGNYKITGGGSNSIDGVYELLEIKDASGGTMSAKEYAKLTTIDFILTINKDNTATIVMSYKKNIDGKATQEIQKYTYDDEAFYGVESDGTKEGVKYFTYKFEKGKITLTVVDGHEQNSKYVYIKK